MNVTPVVMPLSLPAGLAGPAPLETDVRAFLVEDKSRIMLIDTGMDETGAQLDDALESIGATWADVSDVVLTHHHPDHLGGLRHVRVQAARATVWSGDPLPDTQSAHDGTRIGPLRVVSTPGHTPGHVSLLDERSGDVLAGDCVGSVDGRLQRAPAPFTADMELAEHSLQRLLHTGGSRLLFSHGPEIADPWTVLASLLDPTPLS